MTKADQTSRHDGERQRLASDNSRSRNSPTPRIPAKRNVILAPFTKTCPSRATLQFGGNKASSSIPPSFSLPREKERDFCLTCVITASGNKREKRTCLFELLRPAGNKSLVYRARVLSLTSAVLSHLLLSYTSFFSPPLRQTLFALLTTPIHSRSERQRNSLS